MAGGWGVYQDWCNGTDVLGTVAGVSLSTTTANTKGAWTQVISSTTYDSSVITIIADGTLGSNVGNNMCVDIGIGASGSELAIIQNLTVQCYNGVNTYTPQMAAYQFPFGFPAGTRIAARGQSSGTTDVVGAHVSLFDSGFNQVDIASIVDTYGFQTGSTIGTQVDPGATANTKGAYATITSSTSYDLCGFCIGFDSQNSSWSGTSLVWACDVAVGASGSEVIIVPNLEMFAFRFSTTTSFMAPTHFYPIMIPAGSRIAVRGQCNTATSPDRLMGVTFYGVRA